ncbi:hypothetical protein SAMN05444671_2423 [Flavobacterium sp. CF108]|uniref:hypothetical protein n=1 Tax=unclassified Flavobacterium TaxID=196869 RepID=UPI0008C4A7E6|nr:MULTISPECIES: hypothetical protein [unclassified Flavobacterium]SEN91277.1 hypothetical protein SAMN04487978_1739 [Flavobacterium sp. fv08]SHH25884.1 hypothetical protein SAMN05444671_2423 [Flavobacterium sp. CF108]
MTVEQVKQQSLGRWESITVEVRPSSAKNADGTLKPFYLTREFTFLSNDKFELIVINFADPYGKVPLAKMKIKVHTEWKGEHPIAVDAQKADFIADEEYAVTPLLQGFADVLNQYKKGFNKWKAGETQNILGKAFAPFGLTEGQIFKEYDLIYLNNDMMFWGARNIDGRGFDTEANRPANLQIPMIRKK